MSAERAWWARVPLVLRRPREVFAALRDESDEQAHARQEPVLAIVVLAGMAALLSTARAGELLDQPGRGDLVVAVWAFVGGMVYGAAVYFALGVLVLLGMTLAGSLVRYRAARHLLAYAAVPLALSLGLWPLRLLLFGRDSFRTGGSDATAAGTALDVLQSGFALWAVVLLALGIRAYTGFGWGRSLAAAAIPAALPLALLARGHGLV
ncbi:MAG TPA: Yip1 family protein [Gaiellaceae bacterium]|nr:Yip1 family protein [Gaiellaceae bacterium]